MSRFLGGAKALGLLRVCFPAAFRTLPRPLQPRVCPSSLFEGSQSRRQLFASSVSSTSKFREIAYNDLARRGDDSGGEEWKFQERQEEEGEGYRGWRHGGSRRFDVTRGLYDDNEFGHGLEKKDWSQVQLEEGDGVANNYEPPSCSMTEEEAKAFREEHRITLLTKEESVPVPFKSFEETGFPQHIIDILERSGFESPMPVQAQGWPVALTGRDLIAIGQTGSGKTLGYLLPALVHIGKRKRTARMGDGPTTLVLAPTRELAQQIESVLEGYKRGSGVRSVCLFGGASKGPQIRRLESGVDVVIATPGRLIDLLQMRMLNLERCAYVVLDEADRMLDMGFEPQIRKVMGQIRPDRQMLMWSATWPEEVRDLAADLLSDADEERLKKHVHLNIGSVDLQANGNIKQNVSVVDGHEKQTMLISLLRRIMDESAASGEAGEEGKPARVLIFVETKRTVDYIENLLYRERFRASGTHGGKTQAQRDRSLHGFRRGRFPILVATDVASRGLDVDDIQHVVNYDFPKTVEDYIHRIGRTGRRDRTGTSHTFFTAGDAGQARALIKVMRQSDQEVPPELEALRDHRGSSKRSFRNGGRRDYDGRPRYNRDFVRRDRYDNGRDFVPRDRYGA